MWRIAGNEVLHFDGQTVATGNDSKGLVRIRKKVGTGSRHPTLPKNGNLGGKGC